MVLTSCMIKRQFTDFSDNYRKFLVFYMSKYGRLQRLAYPCIPGSRDVHVDV
jgi:hypothetical protein